MIDKEISNIELLLIDLKNQINIYENVRNNIVNKISKLSLINKLEAFYMLKKLKEIEFE